MRRAARIDNNQVELRGLAENLGYEVKSLAEFGKGMPDLLVSNIHDMWLVEIKGKDGKLTPDQVKFHQKWKGKRILIWRTVEDVMNFHTNNLRKEGVYVRGH